jgi:protein-disulfide isomerase
VRLVNDFLRSRRGLFAAVALVAAGIAAALIVTSVVGSNDRPAATTTAAVSATPARPSPVPGAAATRALFRGIPQTLNVLGKPNATVTMVEFADLQCPFCRDYAVSALPALVEEYVRPGKTKLVFSGMHFLGPDSEKALRAVYAAGLQGRLWHYLDLLYKSQGAENSG